MMALAKAFKQIRLIDTGLRYNPIAATRVRRTLHAVARAGLDERRELARQLTARIVARARSTPYGAQFGAKLSSWPILPKVVFRDRQDDFVVPGSVRFPAATGGTTGIPLRLSRSAASIAAEQVFLDWMIRDTGLTWSTARICSLRGDFVKSPDDTAPPFGQLVHGGRRLVLSSPHLSARTLDWYVEHIRRQRPDILWTWPTMAANLMLLLQRAGIAFHVPVVLTSSEQLSPSLHLAMQAEWGARVFDYYGQAERSCFAVGETPGTMTFNPAYGRVELLPTDDIDTALGERAYSIVSTGYWNMAMPLIRYRTEDHVSLPLGATECDIEAVELGLAPVGRIAGRDDDFIYHPDGTRLCGLNQLPRELANVLQVQVVQDTLRDVTLRVLVRDAFDQDDRRQLMANARQKISSEVAIHIEVTSHLETTRNGKTPFVIRHVAAPGPLPQRPLAAAAAGPAT